VWDLSPTAGLPTKAASTDVDDDDDVNERKVASIRIDRVGIDDVDADEDGHDRALFPAFVVVVVVVDDADILFCIEGAKTLTITTQAIWTVVYLTCSLSNPMNSNWQYQHHSVISWCVLKSTMDGCWDATAGVASLAVRPHERRRPLFCFNLLANDATFAT
jgi:hypothetical protein